MSIPAYLAYYLLGGALAVAAGTLAMVGAAVARSGWSQAAQRRTLSRAALLIVGWLALAIALAVAGVYAAQPGRAPTIQYGLLTPILAGLLLMWLSPEVRQVVALAPQHWVVGVEVYRVLGVIFLVLYAAGQLPGAFALPAGIGDTLVGLAAPFVALASARRPQASRRRVLWWNVLGLADLVIAVTMGVLTTPSSLPHLAFDPPSTLVTLFPLVLIPTFAVPASVLLHAASLTKLGRRTAAAEVAVA
jgi:hypothetical protein